MPLFVNDVIEVSYAGLTLNQRTLTIRHYAITNPGTTASESLAVKQIADGFAANVLGSNSNVYLAACGTNFELQEIRAQKISPNRNRFESSPVNRFGTFGELVVTATNVSGVITLQTAKAGRKQIGGIHMPGCPEGAYTGGRPTVAYRNALENIAFTNLNAFTIPASGLVMIPVIYHRVLVGAGTFDPITNTRVQDTLRVMRRRTVGVGI